MEKEKKGLFRRLMDFWRGKTDMDTRERIGFWNEMEPEGKHFAELGAVFSESQEETKKAFWQMREGSAFERQERGGIFRERQEKRIAETAEKEGLWENREVTAESGGSVFQMNFFRERPEEMSAEEKPLFMELSKETTAGEKPFFMKMVEEKGERRKSIPVGSDQFQKKKVVSEEQQEVVQQDAYEEKEMQAEPVIDIEKLMRQMTERLWEERESCGRRLR